MTQHVNRIAHMMPAGPPDAAMREAKHIVAWAMRQHGHERLELFRDLFPGEQPWLLVLDMTHPVTRALKSQVPEFFQGAPQIRAEAEHVGGTLFFSTWVPWELAAELVCNSAKDKPRAQAAMATVRGDGPMAITLWEQGMHIVRVDCTPGNAERDRRRQRARRHGT